MLNDLNNIRQSGYVLDKIAGSSLVWIAQGQRAAQAALPTAPAAQVAAAAYAYATLVQMGFKNL